MSNKLYFVVHSTALFSFEDKEDAKAAFEGIQAFIELNGGTTEGVSDQLMRDVVNTQCSLNSGERVDDASKYELREVELYSEAEEFFPHPKYDDPEDYLRFSPPY